MNDLHGIAAALFFTLAGAQPALADFRLSGPDGPGIVSDAPHVDAGDRPQIPAISTPKWRPHSITNVTGHLGARSEAQGSTVVRGFGDGVPLAFACRQIVPNTIRVVYGRGVDQQTAVTWQGGRAWAAVLRDALQPAGLHLVPHGSTVAITK